MSECPPIIHKFSKDLESLHLKASTISSGQIVLVMVVPADGAITLQRMLYFPPSMARVFVSAIMPALAVEY